MNNRNCIILAAGEGRRMVSSKPKVLMEVLFVPMLGWVLDSVREAGIDDGDVGVIIGNGAEMVTDFLSHRGEDYRTFIQKERRGTAHAVGMAGEMLKDSGDVLVLCGDAPFMNAATINAAYELHKSEDNDVTVITAEISDPANYGRIRRDASGKLIAIVERKDCSGEELAIKEVNSGAYWFKKQKLSAVLSQINNKNAGGEYYLTDAVEKLRPKAAAFRASSPLIILGANNRRELRHINDKMSELINNHHYDKGVDIIGHNVIIGRDVSIGQDTVLMPNTIIRGNTTIGKGCVIGPNTQIDSCGIGDGCVLNNVQAADSVLGKNIKAGPFVNIRPGSVLADGIKIGDFVEVKNSRIGERTSIAHLTYIGDAVVGERVNFGCGCVTANYDGKDKYRTEIGDNAFIGCNTNLIAPVRIGAGAMTAAGSTVTDDVPDGALAIERGKLTIKSDWARRKINN